MNTKTLILALLCLPGVFARTALSVSRGDTDKSFVHISLNGAANMGFDDPVAGDGSGGWADFGPVACLKRIPYGVQVFEDGVVPFHIIDPGSNQGKSVVVLSGPGREAVFPARSPEIRVGRKLNELFFLHTCMYAADTREPVPLIRYRIHYADGTEHLFNCFRGQEVDDWWDPSDEMPRAIRTYREQMTWLINTPWMNPLPQQTIEWVRMESMGNAIPILVALTGSTRSGPYASLMNRINERIKDHRTGTLRIALVQPPKEQDQALNLKNGEAFCREAKEKKADIILFPEMYNIGYNGIDFDEPGALERWNRMAIGPGDTFIGHFRELAAELDVAILITYLERWDGLPRNTALLIDRHGETVLTYAKVHTCDFIDAELHTTPGDGFVVADLDTRLGKVKVGAMICYDREHPESARINMLKGAEIILTPNACNLHPMLLKQFQVRAYENAVVTAMANYSSKGMEAFNGHSCVFNVNGDELLVAGDEPGVYLAGIDLAFMRDFREKTIYGNAFRRPHKYSPLISTEVAEPFERTNCRGDPFQRIKR